ncbi:LA2681 family HEPN domain-containing protein [Teredinibacter sp. KSP-S5-2]|uniref:LA2681 family HEPN domain-containing protein n=1 Tax=Teredinibacter sp. KSP-S5-2 TaxID=3034506 RepID=UPI002934B386|nr:LA2681 family HEPN domain-containing protein [Teredinibacter sp. KSP-S5-2]WNO10484.1 LA2681 family HEPN domain-containing protein [Teredinibacter sp. KSP-S5-2]
MDLNKFASTCDKAINASDIDKIKQLITKASNKVKLDETPDNIKAIYLYYIGNLHSAASKIQKESWHRWREQVYPSHKVQTINAYRTSLLLLQEFSNSPILNEIRTNLANEITDQRRSIEAFEIWSHDFSSPGDAPFVSTAAKIRELIYLHYYINDPGHAKSYIFSAYNLLNTLEENISESSHPGIINLLQYDKDIKNLRDFGLKCSKEDLSWDSTPPTKYSKSEKKYRQWCLENRLFVNHLNDITKSDIADQDILQFPNYTSSYREGPYFSAAFSSLKREYCFARFLAYEGFHKVHPKYENKNLYLVDTLDYVNYEGYTEKLKTSLRICFSIFDSTAQLLNKYYGLEKSKQVAFTPRDLRKCTPDKTNPFLSALFWLSCDLYDIDLSKKSNNWEAPNPSSSAFRKIRNSCEHGWLRVADGSFDAWGNENDYAQIISSESLSKYTLELLKLVRSALIYFCLTIKFEESENSTENSTKEELTLHRATPIYK